MRALLILGLTLAASTAAAEVPSGCKEDYATCKEDCSIEFGGSGRAVKQLTNCLADCQENLGLCADRHSSLKGLPPGVVAEPPRSRRGKKLTREEDPFGDGDSQSTRKRKSREEDPFGDERPTGRREGYRATDSAVATEPTRRAPPPEPVPPPPASSVGTEVRRTGVYRASESDPPPPRSSAPVPADPTSLGDLDGPDDEPTAVAVPEPKPAPPPPVPTPEPVKAPPPAVIASPAKKDPLLDEELPEAPVVKKPQPSKSTKPALPPEPKYDISEWDPNGD
ncbi:hypothetical protein [Comamonas sp. JC664]|uniref:hypothetical protein n=1 Tax=Comamonas sp. JC664 TaxID=2801917 RepID=UPI0017494035|nr:hypothetical protein [Comamonas sp. JC664]MBL0696127.1 hypothetical protein [Comamonas sp. JC664]GHG65425.1 hypothetical protein GCM10012319_06580 [Comamonas sp. KCTC 72670]